MRPDADRTYLSRRGSTALWFAFFGAPLIWSLDLFLVYVTVPYACMTGRTVLLYMLSGSALLISLASGWVGYSIWSDTGQGLPEDQATRSDRSRLLAVVGMMSSGL